jgi:hypothetical protein
MTHSNRIYLRHMKLILLFTAFPILFAQCINHKQDFNAEPSVICLAKLRGSCDIPFSCDRSEFYLVDVSLVNNSDSIIKFIAFTCTTYFNVLFNSEGLSMFRYKCAVNYPNIFTLNPKQKFTVPLILRDTSNMSSEKEIKFGFILSELKYFKKNIDPDVTLREMRERKENVIWSQPIQLYHLTSEPFEITDITEISNIQN